MDNNFNTFNNLPDIPDELRGFAIEEHPNDIEIVTDKIETKIEAMTDSQDEIKGAGEAEAEDEIPTQDVDTDAAAEPAEATEPASEEVQFSFKPLIEAMAEYGVLDLGEGEEVGDTSDDLVNKFEQTVDNRIHKGIEEYKESIPDLGKQFLDYLEKGGDPQKFVQSLNTTFDYKNIDLDNENTQKALVSEYLKLQSYTDSEIAETLQDYEDSLLLEKQAKIALTKLEKLEQDKAGKLVQEQERALEAQKAQYEEYVSGVRNIIKSSTEIAGLIVSDVEKKSFEDYLFKTDKQGFTQYEKELQEDPQKSQIELAFLKFKKYDFSKVAKKAESKAAAKIRQSIINKNEGPARGTPMDARNSGDDFNAFGKIVSLKN